MEFLYSLNIYKLLAMKYNIIWFSILIITFCGCSKNEPPSSSSSSNSSSNSTPATVTLCTTITAKSTVSSNGVSYTINALAGAGNSIGIEVVNSNGAFTSSYSMQLLEVSSGDACATNSSSTESLPGIGKFFEFKNLPAWAANTSTIAKVQIMLDGNVYSIQDLHVNQ